MKIEDDVGQKLAAVGAIGVGDAVGDAGEDEGVGAIAAGHTVLTAAADQRVIAVAAPQHVVTHPAPDNIVGGIAGELLAAIGRPGQFSILATPARLKLRSAVRTSSIPSPAFSITMSPGWSTK